MRNSKKIAEIIHVIAEVRWVSRQLEADRRVTMSRAQIMLRELYETRQVMEMSMNVNKLNYLKEKTTTEDDLYSNDEESTTKFPAIPRISEHWSAFNKERGMMLRKSIDKKLALKIASSIKERLAFLWRPVHPQAASWTPDYDTENDETGVPKHYTGPRPTIFFHLASICDVN